jgi:hypothetical protein
LIAHGKSLTKPLENLLVFKRNREEENKEKASVTTEFGSFDGLYGTIRNLDLLNQNVNFNTFFTFEEFAEKDSEKFKLNYGIRKNLHFYENLPKIAILDRQKLNTYTISTLKIKFGKGRSYQDIKLSYFKLDLIDYEMKTCMKTIFMPEPYVTSKWLIIIGIFALISTCGLCIMKMLKMNDMSDSKKEVKAW